MVTKKTIKERLSQVFQKLGLMEKAKSNTLSEEDWKNIHSSYKKEFGVDLYQEASAAEKEERAKNTKMNKQLLSILNSEDEKDDDEDPEESPENIEGADDEDPEENPENSEGEDDDDSKKCSSRGSSSQIVKKVKGLKKENKELKKQMAKMAGKAEPDVQRITGQRTNAYAMNHTDTHLFGIQHPLFEMSKRWNQVAKTGIPKVSASKKDFKALQDEVGSYGEMLCARMIKLQEEGKLNVSALTGNSLEFDYGDLSMAELGEQFLVRRQDALISRILELPSVFHIFPLRSNVQDQDLITNAFFTEFSQAYQPGEISKGDVSLQPEKAKVHDVMFKTLFESMKWIETQYIGYLNQNGSDPVKWNMIEWMILEIAKKLRAEQNARYILGYRVDPEQGKTYSSLLSSTGIIHRLLSYVYNLQVLPVYDQEYASYTQTTMYDVVDGFVDKIAESVDSFSGKALYLNEKHRKWFADSYRSKFGQDGDFSGSLDKIQGRDLKIVWVPNMGNIQLMFITEEGNLQCLENVPGEMNKIYFEQRLEAVWAYSVWKEGTSAAYAGRKFSSLEELKAADFAEQSIFMNWPAVEISEDSTTPSVKGGIIHKTVDNNEATVISDLLHPTTGLVYVIECGGLTNASTIAKTGKFSEITASWEPKAKGDYIKLYWDKAAGKFKEVERKITA